MIIIGLEGRFGNRGRMLRAIRAYHSSTKWHWLLRLLLAIENCTRGASYSLFRHIRLIYYPTSLNNFTVIGHPHQTRFEPHIRGTVYVAAKSSLRRCLSLHGSLRSFLVHGDLKKPYECTEHERTESKTSILSRTHPISAISLGSTSSN